MILCESSFNESTLHENADGTFTVAGTFQHADLRNENGRVYRRKLWENTLARESIKRAIKERRMLGELGHPPIVETTPVNVSHIVTALELRPDGTVYGEAEILDTPSGKILKTLYKAGVKMGISSRGYLPEGSNLYPEGDDLVVPDDFELITFDFVIDPSTPGANPTIKESVKSTLQNILKESKDKVNPDIVKTLEENIFTLKSQSGLKILKEAKNTVPPVKENKTITRKESNSKMNESKTNDKSIDKLNAVITDLRDRYLTAESIIDDLMEERLRADEVLQDITRRYLTAESVIKEFAAYTKKVEESLSKLSETQNVSENVIADLRDRYTLSEKVIEMIRDRYNVAEGVIADLRDRVVLSEGVIAELRDRYTLSEKSNKQLEGKATESSKSLTESSTKVSDLTKKLEISEGIISELQAQVKELTEKKKGTPVPANYFEEISQNYNISISEAKKLFKSLGCKKSAFEFHLEERKKLVSNNYSEFPYMIDKAPVGNVYAKTELDEDVERTARLVHSVF